MAMQPRTCVVCRKPLKSTLRLRLWITRHGLDFHFICFRTMRKDEARRDARMAARFRSRPGGFA